MTALVTVRLALGAVVVTALSAAGLWHGRETDTPPATDSGHKLPAVASPATPSRTAPYRAADVAQRNPFRKDRRPAAVAFGEPARRPVPVVQAPAPPVARLHGVVLGAEPAAFIAAGDPSAPIQLVLVGERIGSATLERVFRDSVTLRTADSVLVLRLVQP